MKKPTNINGGNNCQPYEMSDWSDEYPTLWSFLTTCCYDCGTIRLTSSLTVFVQDGILKACVNDRDLERSAFFTGPTMESLLNNVEKGLAADDCDWRVKKGMTGQSKPPY